MAYLIRTVNGKENLITMVLQKSGLEVHSAPEKGFLVCDSRPSPQLLFELEGYLLEITEITPEERERFLILPKKTAEEIKVGSLVQITSGVYKDFSGIVRRVSNGVALVDLSLFGRVFPAEISIDMIKRAEIGDPWL